jgi:ribosome-associated protein
MIRILEGVELDEREISERFVRASGPGGQNVNKVATAVQLRFDVPASTLPEEIKRRLTVLAAGRLTTEGVLIIDSREYRTQAQNREAARERLIVLIREAARRPKKRRATRPNTASRERRLQSKRRRSETKKLRGRGDE